MSVLSPWFPSFWDALGWTMLHFLWVGALVALFARLVLWAVRRRSPQVRYAMALAGFLLLALTPAVLFAWKMANFAPVASITEGIEIPRHAGERIVGAMASFRQPSPANNQQEKPGNTKDIQPTVPLERAASVAASSARKADVTPPSLRLRIGNDVQRAVGQSYGFALRMLPWLWVCGFPLACAWIVLGVTGTERLRRDCRPLENEEWLSLCRRLKQQLGIRIPAQFAVSDRLAVPLLIGIVRPLVLLPARALCGYSPDQVEMIVLHELAHVRRWDNLVNLLQRLVEAVLFFHPSVWWLSRRVRLEREHCCDAVVLAHTGAPQRYAEFLAHLALPGIVPQCVLGVSAGEQLVARIRHILNQENQSMKVSRSSVIATSAFFVALIAVAITWVHLKAAAAPVEIEMPARTPRLDEEASISTPPQQPHAAHGGPFLRAVAQATTPGAVQAQRPSLAASPGADTKAGGFGPAIGGMRLSRPSAAEQEKAQMKFAGRAFWQWENILLGELDPKMRVEALDALGRFGAFGYEKEASAAIAKFLSKGRLIPSDQGDQKVEEAAQAAFSRIGPPALQTTLQLLKDKSPEVRRLATEIVSALLREVPEPKPSTLESLAEVTNDRDESVALGGPPGTVPDVRPHKRSLPRPARPGCRQETSRRLAGYPPQSGRLPGQPRPLRRWGGSRAAGRLEGSPQRRDQGPRLLHSQNGDRGPAAMRHSTRRACPGIDRAAPESAGRFWHSFKYHARSRELGIPSRPGRPGTDRGPEAFRPYGVPMGRRRDSEPAAARGRESDRHRVGSDWADARDSNRPNRVQGENVKAGKLGHGQLNHGSNASDPACDAQTQPRARFGRAFRPLISGRSRPLRTSARRRLFVAEGLDRV